MMTGSRNNSWHFLHTDDYRRLIEWEKLAQKQRNRQLNLSSVLIGLGFGTSLVPENLVLAEFGMVGAIMGVSLMVYNLVLQAWHHAN